MTRKSESLLTSTINSIKKILKKRGDDFETVSFWLANSCRFLHCLKQYSGDEQFMKYNSPKQNEHCLSNFDLAEYRQVLSDLAIQIYQQLIKCMENILQPMIVSGMLEHETIQGVSGVKPTGSAEADVQHCGRRDLHTGTPSSDSSTPSTPLCASTALTPSSSNRWSNSSSTSSEGHCAHGARACRSAGGVAEGQEPDGVWGEGDAGASHPGPLSCCKSRRRRDEDAEAICSMCNSLTTAQIVKVLNLYTPVNAFEERVSVTFIRTIQNRLRDRKESPQLLLDTKIIYPGHLPPSTPPLWPWRPSKSPASLNLAFLTRV
ncbi:hypothetical protein MHYP_G00129900 [Metynnis hypsauchen]